MRAVLLALWLLWQVAGSSGPPVASPAHLRYERTLEVPAGEGQACAALDAEVFPHAAPSLKDLRVFPAGAGAHEVPYAITLSETATQETQSARVLNLGKSGANIVFDLEMPDRAYTDVTLDLAGQDFLATAMVWGTDVPGGKLTALGVFTLFDLSSQHLSRDTTLPLTESTFRVLHVSLLVVPAPGTAAVKFAPAMVQGAQVPPSRQAQTVYTTVAVATAPTTGSLASPRTTRFDFALPPRVPVERVSFDLAKGDAGNFKRDVTVSASPDDSDGPGHKQPASVPVETVPGTIWRVRTTQTGRRIDERQLSVLATLGANLQRPAHVWVEIANGDDQPLPIAAVRLEMRQRRLCFDAPPSASRSAPPTLYYGDPALAAPVYDYQRLFVASAKPLLAKLGPERLNPAYAPPPVAVRPFTERHPEVLWLALIGVICVLGTVALKSSRNVGR